jgi:hypothetical protein
MADAKYREQYEHCLALAQRSASPEQRAMFLQMAQSWKALAEQSETIRDLFKDVIPKGTA